MEDGKNSVCGQFSKISAVYDSQRRFMIPRFDDFYGAAVSVLDLPPHARISDLGAGTGIMAAFVLEKYPDASCQLVDVSADMLEKARARFGAGGAVEFLESDFANWNPESGSFDAVVSALAIHHIDDAQKRALFSKIFSTLKDGGIFVNAEQVLCATQAERAAARADREAIIVKHFSEADAAVARKRLLLDKCATVADQKKWLSDAGFKSVQIRYEYLDFAVFAARK